MADVLTAPPGANTNGATTALDELARDGARRLIAAALEAEVEEYVSSFSEELDQDGQRLVVRNGYGRPRRVTVGSGIVELRVPRIDDRRIDEETGERKRFGSRILPAYARHSPKVTEVLPILYLCGMSTGNFRPALECLLREVTSGLSPSTISRMCKEWETEHVRFGPASWAAATTPICSAAASTSRWGSETTIPCACWW